MILFGLDEIVDFVTCIGCNRWISFASDKACLRYLCGLICFWIEHHMKTEILIQFNYCYICNHLICLLNNVLCSSHYTVLPPNTTCSYLNLWRLLNLIVLLFIWTEISGTWFSFGGIILWSSSICCYGRKWATFLYSFLHLGLYKICCKKFHCKIWKPLFRTS